MTQNSAPPAAAAGRASAILRPLPDAVAFVPMLAALWAICHRYQGFARDGELYAVQAFARIRPQLAADLYLQNTTQDQFTAFSPLYSLLMSLLGVQGAESLLFVACSVWFLGASWVLARRLSDESTAWLTAALLIVTIGYYGAYQIFSYSENYLTARSLAEALVVTSFCCHFRGRPILALAIAFGSMFFHPLMTLPGLLLLVYLRLSAWHAAGLAAAGTVTALAIALLASIQPAGFHWLTVVDPAWLEVVRERSQFLFLKYWTMTDWEIAARPFVCLTLTALVIPRGDVRKLCFAAMLVGASGLAVAWIACTVGPAAILLQGQAWRWVWITGFVSVLLTVPTAIHAWGDSKCGPLVALLLISGWTFADVDGLACTEGSLILWLSRDYISAKSARYLGWAAAAFGAIVAATVVANCWTFASAPIPETGRESVYIGRLREVFSLGAPAVLLVVAYWSWVRRTRTALPSAIAAVAFTCAFVLILPGSVKQLSTVGSAAEVAEFAAWREKIPERSSVLIVPTRKSAAFAWFTLERPSYLSVDQSSGVVFSRTTAQEVRRRSDILLPVADPDWQILTQIEEVRAGKRKAIDTPKPLTASALETICADPVLGFVVAKENLGFEHLTHRHPGNWMGWNLYDCRHLRLEAPGA